MCIPKHPSFPFCIAVDNKNHMSFYLARNEQEMHDAYKDLVTTREKIGWYEAIGMFEDEVAAVIAGTADPSVARRIILSENDSEYSSVEEQPFENTRAN